MNKIRINELDLLRFIAALSVVLYHYTYRHFEQDGTSLAVFPLVEKATRFGYLGVNLFFIISGFVILWTAMNKSPSGFVITRIARLYPAFWFAVVATTLLHNFAGSDPTIGPMQFIANMTMLSGYLDQKYVDGVYWTLQIEIKFYFLVFLLLLTRQIQRIETWLGLWLVVTCYCYLFHAGPVIKSLSIFPYSPYFIAGALLFLIRSRGLSAYRVAALMVAVVLSVVHAAGQSQEFLLYDADTDLRFVAAILVAVIYAVFLAIVTGIIRIGATPITLQLGALTYPLYLIHNRNGKMLFDYTEGVLNKYVVLAAAITLAFVFSAFVVYCVERPVCKRLAAILERWRDLLYARAGLRRIIRES